MRNRCLPLTVMSRTRKLALAVAGLSFTVFGVVAPVQAHATPASAPAPANPTITITSQGVNYTYSPAQVSAKVGQPITITNKDPNGVHSVTANDRSFSVDVPPQGSVTLKVSKAGSYPYYCTYHPDAHNPATLTIS
jgi:plastocyanin